jgi:Rrf2 family transcriptional regulator, nitric oxide-sensitive transcriptional repressor
MISQTSEYALRAIVWLAEHRDRAQTTDEIARGMNIPAGYLSKVLQTLARARLVVSQRGLGGGFVLARPPSEISPLDVINAVDPIRRIEHCPVGRRSHAGKFCPLHARLDAAVETIEESLRSCTIEELCSEGG